jgi:molecular chaperone DnaK (HSP70)
VTTLGIDFGSALAQVATVGVDGNAVSIPDRSGRFATPVAVGFLEGAALVGDSAEQALVAEAADVVTGAIKARLGSPEHLLIDDGGLRWTAVGLAGLVLRKLQVDAEGYLTRAITGAVLACPDDATLDQQRGLRNAAYLAGVAVLDMVHESDAAFAHYRALGFCRQGPTLVCDFGASGFRCSVYAPQGETLANVARREVSANALDAAALELVLERARTNAEHLAPRRRRALAAVVSALRRRLGAGAPMVSEVVALDGRLVEIGLTERELKRLVAPLLEKAASAVLEALDVAGVGLGQVTDVVLAGGFAQAPGVRTAIETLLGRGASRLAVRAPENAVALGAAVRAEEVLASGVRARLPAEYRGVAPASIGLRVLEPLTGRATVDLLVNQGSALPSAGRRVYYATHEAQERMVFEIVEVEGREASKLGEVDVIPGEKIHSGHAVELSLEVGTDGVLRVETYDPDSGDEQRADFRGRSDVVDPGSVAFLDPVRNLNLVSGAS